MDQSNKKTFKNTIMLFLMTFAKMIFPLITLPYLTRILTPDTFGGVSYVKSCMAYMQLIIDFGFILSSVKDIVRARNKEEISNIIGETILAKMLLSIVSFVVLIIMICTIPILKGYELFMILSFITVFLSSFLLDFLFRGIEKMEIMTIIFVIMKSISTLFTFILVKNDSHIILIPLLDIISSVICIFITSLITMKLGFRFKVRSIKSVFVMLKNSFNYFMSNMATTAFGALNTILIGIVIGDKFEIAKWTVCMQIISAIQSLYSPIINGIYPQMVKTKNYNLIIKVVLICMPIVILGSAALFFLSKFFLLVVGGENYVVAYPILRALIPLLIISFPAMLYGWPTLGAIDMEKQTSYTTVFTACVQVLGLIFLILIDKFNLINLCYLRFITEFGMFIVRYVLTKKNKSKFFIKQDKECNHNGFNNYSN